MRNKSLTFKQRERRAPVQESTTGALSLLGRGDRNKREMSRWVNLRRFRRFGSDPEVPSQPGRFPRRSPKRQEQSKIKIRGLTGVSTSAASPGAGLTGLPAGWGGIPWIPEGIFSLQVGDHSERTEVEVGLGHQPCAGRSLCYMLHHHHLSCLKSKWKRCHLFCAEFGFSVW